MSGRLTLLFCIITTMACGKSTHEPPAEPPAAEKSCPSLNGKVEPCPFMDDLQACLENPSDCSLPDGPLICTRNPEVCSAEDEGRICITEQGLIQAQAECSGGEWIFLAGPNGHLVTPGNLTTPGLPDTMACPIESASVDAFIGCGASYLKSPGNACCTGNKAVVRIQVTGDLVTNVEVVSFVFPCGVYEDLMWWVDPFLSCMAPLLAQAKISCDPAISEVEVELKDDLFCVSGNWGDFPYIPGEL